MRQQAAGQRSRRQTAPPRPPLDLQAKKTEELDESPDGLDTVSNIRNELDFTQWFNEVEESLLETSYDEYQYVVQGPRASATIRIY